MIKLYYPYISDKPDKKFLIFTNTGKKVYFGATEYEHYTEGHLDIKRRNNYIQRHQKKEDWEDPNTSGYWAAKLLWLYPTYKEAYYNIKHELIKKKYL